MNKVEIDGRMISIRREGAGTPVLCLHSSSSHSGQFKPLIQSLRGRFEVIAPDVHGYGRSDPLPRDGSPWFLHDLKITERFCGASNGKVHLVGHSLGAALACLTAMRWPERIASLTLIEPVLFMFLKQANHNEIADAYEVMSIVLGNLVLDRPEAAAKAFMDFWSGEGAFDAAPPNVQSYVVETIERVADDWSGVVINTEHTPQLDELKRLDMPVLLMRGTKSRSSARAILDVMKTKIPHASLVDIQDAGHMAAATHPDLINPTIIHFIESVESRV